MRFLRHNWQAWIFCLAVLLLGGGAISARPPDPVEKLREALPMRLEDLRQPTKLALEHRRRTLQARIDALRSFRDLREALALTEWRDDFIDEQLRDLDLEMRRLIGTRFKAAINRIIRSGEAASRLAVANMIAEMGPSIRALDPFDTKGFARGLAPEVIQLTRDASLAVRLEALRALGTINADPAIAAPVLEDVLKTGELPERRVASYALGQLVRVVDHLLKSGHVKTGVEATREDFIRAAAAAVIAADTAFGDDDAQVRYLAYQAVDVAANAWGDFILEPFPRTDFPPPGRPLTQEEINFIMARRDLLSVEFSQFAPLTNALKKHSNGLAQGLRDPSPRVRLVAGSALENVAYARQRIVKRIESIPEPETTRLPVFGPDHWATAAFDDPLAGFVDKHLRGILNVVHDPEDPRIRRVAIDFLERMERAAMPTAPALAQRLGDADRFVRWSAARTLSKLAPQIAATDPERNDLVVSGLAKLLSDTDMDVRMAAAETLELIGAAAAAALPALNQAVLHGDSEPRIAAMYALMSVGLDSAPRGITDSAINNLLQSLAAKSTPDARVRRLAAQALGALVPRLPQEMTVLRQAAIRGLRDALGDEDSEVRLNASDAILNIQVGAAPKTAGEIEL